MSDHFGTLCIKGLRKVTQGDSTSLIIGRLQAQIQPMQSTGFENQPRYEALGDLLVELENT